MEQWYVEEAADGFNIMPPYLPGALDDFVELVIPELQRRGLFRTEYTGRTLREHLGLPRPPSRYARAPTKRRSRRHPMTDAADCSRARCGLSGAGAMGGGAAALRRRRRHGAARASHVPRLVQGHRRPDRQLPSVVQMYDRKGYHPGWFWAYCTVLTQFVAAPCVALGLLTRPMALPLFLLMALSAYDHLQIRRLVLEQDGLRISGDVGDRRAVFPDQRRRADFTRSSVRI